LLERQDCGFLSFAHLGLKTKCFSASLSCVGQEQTQGWVLAGLKDPEPGPQVSRLHFSHPSQLRSIPAPRGQLECRIPIQDRPPERKEKTTLIQYNLQKARGRNTHLCFSLHFPQHSFNITFNK
jgi:hypothetical protein